jgi:hypothetical protein
LYDKNPQSKTSPTPSQVGKRSEILIDNLIGNRQRDATNKQKKNKRPAYPMDELNWDIDASRAGMGTWVIVLGEDSTTMWTNLSHHRNLFTASWAFHV